MDTATGTRPISVFQSGTTTPSMDTDGGRSDGHRLFTASTAVSVTVVLATLVGVFVAAFSVTTLVIFSQEWNKEVKTLDEQLSLRETLLDAIDSDLTQINATMPAGDGVTFFDDTWRMAHGPDPSRSFQFNASLVSPGQTRVYTFPDDTGVVLLEQNIPLWPVEFSESEFAVYGALDPNKRIVFNVDISPTNTTRTYRWPNQNGEVALLENVIDIVANSTVFADDLFAIANDPNVTAIARFDLSGLTPGINRIVYFPDMDGQLMTTDAPEAVFNKIFDGSNSVAGGALPSDVVFEAKAQPMSNKFMDDTNEVTIRDTRLTIEDSGSAFSFQLDADLLTADRQYAFPDESGELALQSDIPPPPTLDQTALFDDEFGITHDADENKIMRVDVSGVAPGENRTMGIPEEDGTILTDATANIRLLARKNNDQAVGSFLAVVSFDNIADDPMGGWSSSIQRYIIPRTGYYSASAVVSTDTTGTDRTNWVQFRVEGPGGVNPVVFYGSIDAHWNGFATSRFNLGAFKALEGGRVGVFIRQDDTITTILGRTSIGFISTYHTYFSLRYIGPIV